MKTTGPDRKTGELIARFPEKPSGALIYEDMFHSVKTVLYPLF